MTRIEDGFIRSQGLGCEKIPPVSIIMDRSGYLYFDGARKSELDSLIENYQFSEEELKISEDFLNVISSSTTNKYNLDVCSTLPKKVGVLVIGQVESDLSVIHGKGFATNLELIKLAIKENPSEPIYYKRHPDILAGKREVEYGLDEILKISEVIDFELSQEVTPEVFKTVYVNTSLLGFELLIRGFIIRVTGRPFYWGLGLTNDLQYDSSRRNISLQKLAYIVYVLYPVYSSGNWAFIDKKVKEILFEKANYGLS
ncbi:hypothetical protein NRZ30_20030 [Aeromonas jandaei]|uniref:capsular polysaccharide export protein, LipB/KpsS family n=1 Tax=Aeromonas jandaei TaxID=650 RepID=UPI00227D441D|nr:hypothetical protein [Aeromonas jandaei]WAG07291.1 hypothetical protein NRZ30_20030 [Aeromonas jandaei]